MAAMSRRAGKVIVIGVILIGVASGIFLLGQALDAAAAWANILALPIGLMGLAIAVWGLVRREGVEARPERAGARPVATGGGAPVQIGIAGRDQLNIASGTVNITNHRGRW